MGLMFEFLQSLQAVSVLNWKIIMYQFFYWFPDFFRQIPIKLLSYLVAYLLGYPKGFGYSIPNSNHPKWGQNYISWLDKLFFKRVIMSRGQRGIENAQNFSNCPKTVFFFSAWFLLHCSKGTQNYIYQTVLFLPDTFFC